MQRYYSLMVLQNGEPIPLGRAYKTFLWKSEEAAMKWLGTNYALGVIVVPVYLSRSAQSDPQYWFV